MKKVNPTIIQDGDRRREKEEKDSDDFLFLERGNILKAGQKIDGVSTDARNQISISANICVTYFVNKLITKMSPITY